MWNRCYRVFFHWSLEAKNCKENNHYNALSKSSSSMCTLIEELSQLLWLFFFRLSGFPDLFFKVFLITFKFSFFDFSTTFLQEHCKWNCLISFFITERLKWLFITITLFKVGLLRPKNIYVICLTESPLKMMKNAYNFILNALFVLKIFMFFSRLFVM